MRLGMYMRELWRSKAGLAIALLMALLVVARVNFGIGLIPPRIDHRPLETASASTHVLVDTPRSTLIDLSQDAYQISALSTRAVILGNVMASPPVREFIARRVGVDPESIEATGPRTPEQPRPVAGPETQPQVSDIAERPDEYRLSIQVNPTVPILDIYSQGPRPEAAKDLADGAVDGLQDYLNAVAAGRGTTVADDQIELQQLGRARGGVINDGAGLMFSLLVFVAAFIVSSAIVLLAGRVRRGWSASDRLDGPPARGLT